eukprot:tig00021319_g20239.t2
MKARKQSAMDAIEEGATKFAGQLERGAGQMLAHVEEGATKFAGQLERGAGQMLAHVGALLVDREKVEPMVMKLSPYVPEYCLRRFATGKPMREMPEHGQLFGAILFTDISGFTPLCEKFGKMGAAGAERVRDHLSAYFGRLIPIIVGHGGDVIKFAGDALISLFWGNDESDLAHCTLSATACALQALSQLSTYDADGVTLQMHIGVGAGKLSYLYVGSTNRREFLIAGDALTQIASAEADAKSGEVCLSPEAWRLVRGRCQMRPVSGSQNMIVTSIMGPLPDSIRFIPRAEDIPTPIAAEMEPWWARYAACWGCRTSREPPIDSGFIHYARQLSTDTLVHVQRELERYVPSTVLVKMRTGQFKFLAELRAISVVFVSVLGLDYDSDDGLRLANSAVAAMIEALEQYGGSLRQFISDDKGSVLIGIWGLPHATYEDNPTRATLSAIEIGQRLKKFSLGCSIGVTSGRAFCGTVGSPMRMEYAVVGDVVNLSARLMSNAKGEMGNILIDEATYTAASSSVTCNPKGSIKVKGKELPIKVFNPLFKYAVGRGASNSASAANQRKTALVGRSIEVQLLSEAASRLVRERTHFQGPRVIVVEGESGVGKTRLVQEAVGLGSAHGKEGRFVFDASATEMEAGQPLAVWRRLYSAIANELMTSHGGAAAAEAEAGAGPAKAGSASGAAGSLKNLQFVSQIKVRTQGWMVNVKRQRFMQRVEQLGGRELAERVSLLNGLVPLELPESEVTKKMAARKRPEELRRLLADLTVALAAYLPVTLIIDDAHWMDAESWEVLEAVMKASKSVLLVLAMRAWNATAQRSVPPQLQRFLQSAGRGADGEARRVALAPLAREDVLAMIEDALAVRALPETFASMILQRAQGNAYFSLELAYAARDKGIIEIRDARATMSASAETLSNLDVILPATLQGVISSRIDGLPPGHQLVLKVAACIGPQFEYEILRTVYPVEADKPELPTVIEALEERAFIARAASPPEVAPSPKTLVASMRTKQSKLEGVSFTFCSTLIREICYGQLSLSNRRDLHAAIASAYRALCENDVTAARRAALSFHEAKAADEMQGTPPAETKERRRPEGPRQPETPRRVAEVEEALAGGAAPAAGGAGGAQTRRRSTRPGSDPSVWRMPRSDELVYVENPYGSGPSALPPDPAPLPPPPQAPYAHPASEGPDSHRGRRPSDPHAADTVVRQRPASARDPTHSGSSTNLTASGSWAPPSRIFRPHDSLR